MAHHWSMNMTIISMRGRYSEYSCPNRNVTTRVPVTARHCRQGDTRITHGKKKSWEQFGWQIDDEYSLLLPYPWPVPPLGECPDLLLVTGQRRETQAGAWHLIMRLWAESGGHRRGTNTWWPQPSVVFHRSHSAHLPPATQDRYSSALRGIYF